MCKWGKKLIDLMRSAQKNAADAVGAPIYCEKSSEASWARDSWVKTARKKSVGTNIVWWGGYHP